MAIQILGADGSTVQKVDATAQAERSTLYNVDGTAMGLVDRVSLGVTPGTTPGLPLVGADFRTPVILRSTSEGTLIAGDRMLLLYDRAEGAAVNTNTWIQTTATMTITQAGGLVTLNANNTLTTTTGAMQTSHRWLPFISRASLVGKFRVRATAHTNNNLIEVGFASPASSTSASLVNGAVWRKDANGNWSGVISVNGVEVLGTLISNATWIAQFATTDFATLEVFVQNNRVLFSAFKTTGELAFFQALTVTVASTSFQQTHLQAMYRTYNSGTVVTTAVQLIVDDVSIWASDFQPNKPWPHQLSGNNFNFLTSPTAYTQTANYANSAAPASATLSNTAAGYATLGGLYQFVAVAGAATDYALFALAIPSPYSFTVTGINISLPYVVSLTTGFTAPLIMVWGAAFNSSAVSLATGAPYAPMRVALGTHAFGGTAVATVGLIATQSPIMWTPQTPPVVQPGRFIHIILRMPVLAVAGTACVVGGSVAVDGYFE